MRLVKAPFGCVVQKTPFPFLGEEVMVESSIVRDSVIILGEDDNGKKELVKVLQSRDGEQIDQVLEKLNKELEEKEGEGENEKQLVDMDELKQWVDEQFNPLSKLQQSLGAQ